MKINKLLMFALTIALFFSCSSDNDDNNDQSTDSMVGTWLLTAIDTETAFDLNQDGVATASFMDETNCYQN